MSHIFVIGAGASSRELSVVIEENGYTIESFVDIDDKDGDILRVAKKEHKIIGETKFHNMAQESFKKGTPLNIVFALGNRELLTKLVDRFKDICTFPNIISKSVTFLDECKMGVGNVISFNNLISLDVKIGSFNYFNFGNTIGHDVVIGDENIFNPSSNVSGDVRIGNNNLIGAKSFIYQGLTIGDENVIGAGSIILYPIDNRSTFSCRAATKLEQR